MIYLTLEEILGVAARVIDGEVRNHLRTKQGAMPYFVVSLHATHCLTDYIYIDEL